MNGLLAAAYFWVLAFVVFKVNPLNDPTNLGSRFNYYHPSNVLDRRLLEEDLVEDEREGKDPGMVLYWTDIWPILCPTIWTVGFAFILALRGV